MFSSLKKMNKKYSIFITHKNLDRDPGVNGLTGVTIRGEDAAIQSATSYIQQLVAAK